MVKIIGGLFSDSYLFCVGSRISFSKGAARVFSYPCDGKVIETLYKLTIPPLPSVMPIEDALDEERQVQWFLQNGYAPQIKEVDGEKKIGFVQKRTAEQDISIQELLKKCDSLSDQLAIFLRAMREKTLVDLNTEQYQGWHTLLAACGEATLADRASVIYWLLEDCKQSLRLKDFYSIEETIVALLQLTISCYIFNDLHADFLALVVPEQAADRYLTLSGLFRETEQGVVNLEKALRCDPENPAIVEAVCSLKCPDERALHCCYTAYVACRDKTSQAALKYFQKAKLLVKSSIKDSELRPFLFPPKPLDQSQSWIARSQSSSPSVTPIMGLKSPRSRKQVGSPAGTIRIEFSESGLKEQYKKEPNSKSLEALLWWYDGEKEWSKAEYVARMLYEAEKKFDVGVALARALAMQGKVGEAQRRHFELAKAELGIGNKDNARTSLVEILSLNSSIGEFSYQEKCIIYLMLLELKCRDHNALRILKESIQNSRTPRSARDTVAIASRGHSGEWAWCAVEHPHYVAAASTVSEMFLFSNSTVEVNGRTYPLQMTSAVPDELALFGAKRVRWMLSQGYVPAICDDTVVLIKESKRSYIDRLDASTELLKKCKEYIEKGYLGIAYYYIYKAYMQNPKTVELIEFYAEFLLLIDKPEKALELFLLLTKEEQNKLYYHKRALVAACLCKSDRVQEFYRDTIRVLQKNIPEIQLLTLHGYLFFQCHKPAQEGDILFLYDKAKGHFAGDSAALACQTEPREKRKLYKRLADRFTNEPQVYDYYAALYDFECESITPTTVKQAVVAGRKRDMKQFVESAAYRQHKLLVKRHLKVLYDHIDKEEYENAERALLQARKDHRVTSVQQQIRELNDSYVEYVQKMPAKGSLAPFFTSAGPALSRIKEALDPLDPVVGAIQELEECVKKKNLEKAKNCFLRVCQLGEVSEAQKLITPLFSAYLECPFVPGVQEKFMELFAEVSIPFPQRLEHDIETYLQLAEEQQDGDEFSNGICAEWPCSELFYLEHALALVKDEVDHAVRVYNAIDAQLAREETVAHRFLLCLHGFFYFKRHGYEDQAEFFLRRAEGLNPTSLLLGCAKILQLAGKREQLMEYNRIVAICDSEKELEAYFDKQRDFTVASSLETYVNEECGAILNSIYLREKKRATLVVVDLLFEKKYFELARSQLALLAPCSSVHKRLWVMNNASGNTFGVSNALKALHVCYEQGYKEEPRKVVTRLLDRFAIRTDAERVEELLAEGKRDEAAQLYFERAFFILCEGNIEEARKRLTALQELDPNYEQFDSEEKLMLQLIDSITMPLENSFAKLSISQRVSKRTE